jgi:hypothetical protein
VKGDSQLIIKQARGECSYNEPRLAAYLLHVKKLEKDFAARNYNTFLRPTTQRQMTSPRGHQLEHPCPRAP